MFVISYCNINNATSSAGIFLENVSVASIDNCYCFGNKNGLEFINVDKAVVSSCIISNNGYYGISLKDSVNNLFSNITCHSNALDGVHTVGGSNNQFEFLSAVGNGQRGFHLQLATETEIRNSDFVNHLEGIYVTFCNDTVIDNCFFDVNVNAIKATQGSGLTISSSYLDSSLDGLVLSYVRETYIENLSVVASSQKSIDLDHVEDSIFSNVFTNQGTFGIESTAGSNNHFTNLSIQAASTNGIFLSLCNDSTFQYYTVVN